MSRRIVNPQNIHVPTGYSHIAIATGSSLAFIAGQIALDRDGQLVGPGDLRAQTEKVMENLTGALTELGVSWDDVVQATVYTTQPAEALLIADVMTEAMNGVAPPAQVLLGVTNLALPEFLIEIAVVVSLP